MTTDLIQPLPDTRVTLSERLRMRPELAIGYLGLLLFMIGDGVEAGFLSPMLIGLHFTPSQVAIVFSAYGATAAVASWLSGTLSDIFGPRKVMWAGLLIWLAFEMPFLTLGVAHMNYPAIVVSYALRGFGYLPEKRQKGKRRWQGKAEEQQAVYDFRRRVKGDYGKRLLKRRDELVERSFAHCYETGGMRRCHLRGRDNILKRQLAHVSAFNLSLVMRQLLGAGTPRELTTRLVVRILRFLAGQNRPKSVAEPQTYPVLASPGTYRETGTRCRMIWNSVTCTTGC